MRLNVFRQKGAATLFVVALVIGLAWWIGGRFAFESTLPTVAMYGTYSTNFPVAENPISEGGNWINGRTTGLKWADVRAIPGLAFGTQSGGGGYDDSTAIVAGKWGPTQTVTATIHTTNPQSSGAVFQEVELRLRTTIAANTLTGYEVNFSCSANPAYFYSEIVRWNGPIGSFSYINRTKYHCKDGDVVKARISRSTIEVFVNNAKIMSGKDKTFSTGNPGIGFFLTGIGSESNSDFGFSNFTATDVPN